MKVVQVTTSSRGGAGIAALRLHRALRKAGVSSAFLSKDLSIDFEGNTVEDDFFAHKRASVLSRLGRKISPSDKDRIQKTIAGMEPNLSYEMLSLPFSTKELESHPFLKEGDLVNLHMVTSILDYERFFSVYKKPVVWTLHDMNPFMGLFHYNGDREKNNITNTLDQNILEYKQKAISQCTAGALASPSQWLLDLAEASNVFSGFSHKKVIPNSIDLEVFSPTVHSLREDLQIAPNEKVLLFAAGSLHIDRKGFDLLLEALSSITFPLTLLTLGKGEVEVPNEAVKVIPLGFKSEPQEIAACFATANACILPSREDNLPNTMLEAMATGTPVICFANGGMKEHITTGFNGVLANELSGKSLAEAITSFFDTQEGFSPQKIRHYAEERFSPEIQTESYKALYTEVWKP